MKNTFKVGRYTCEMTLKADGQMIARWRPDVPPPRSLSEKAIRQYQSGRNALMEEFGKMTGTRMMVVE